MSWSSGHKKINTVLDSIFFSPPPISTFSYHKDVNINLKDSVRRPGQSNMPSVVLNLEVTAFEEAFQQKRGRLVMVISFAD